MLFYSLSPPHKHTQTAFLQVKLKNQQKTISAALIYALYWILPPTIYGNPRLSQLFNFSQHIWHFTAVRVNHSCILVLHKLILFCFPNHLLKKQSKNSYDLHAQGSFPHVWSICANLITAAQKIEKERYSLLQIHNAPKHYWRMKSNSLVFLLVHFSILQTANPRNYYPTLLAYPLLPWHHFF